MKPYTSHCAIGAALLLAMSAISNAILVQPYNYMLDDSSIVPHHDSTSLSPFYNDHSEQGADKDIVSIISDSLARLRFARMLDHDNQQDETANNGQLSQEMAELIQNEQQHQQANKQEVGEQSLSSSVANMLLNVAQAAASAGDEQEQNSGNNHNGDPSLGSRGSLMEMDSSSATATSSSLPSKSDLKVGPSQWYNPKETIPVLKISSMGKCPLNRIQGFSFVASNGRASTSECL